MKITEVTVDPGFAAELLEKNTHNRSVRVKMVHAYAADMRSGVWRANGETIKIASDGTIIDGQHRLLAVVEADVAVDFIIVTGLPMAAQDTIDTGKQRTFGDSLRLRGEVNYNVLAAVVRRLHLWEKGIHRSRSVTMAPSKTQLFETLNEHPDIRDSVVVATQAKRHVPLTAATTGLFHWIFRRIDAGDCDDFFTKLYGGANLSADHPVFVLRAMLINSAARGNHHRIDEDLAAALLVKAWNAYRSGRTVRSLAWRPGGANPEKFPIPR